MLTGEQLTLNALRKEHKRLSRKAEQAKKDADEYLSAGSELIAVHNEFAEIVQSRNYGGENMKKLDDLQRRQNRIRAVMKKDLLALLDRQSTTEIELQTVAGEISRLEYRLSLRGVNNA